MRRTLYAPMLLLAALQGDARAADSATSVTIVSVGPQSFRVRVAAGAALPCDSSANTELYEGLLKSGEPVTVSSPSGYVCVQQTYEDFPDVGWSLGFLAWGRCWGWGGKKDGPYCVRGDGTIQVTLRSTPPKK